VRDGLLLVGAGGGGWAMPKIKIPAQQTLLKTSRVRGAMGKRIKQVLYTVQGLCLTLNKKNSCTSSVAHHKIIMHNLKPRKKHSPENCSPHPHPPLLKKIMVRP